MNYSTSLSKHAHWLLRVALLSVFLYHAFGQILALDSVMNATGISALGTGFVPLSIAAAVLELIGCVLIVAGGLGHDRLTRIGALLFIPVMLGAIVLFHIKHGWQKMELEFTLLMISLYFVLHGNGAAAPEAERT